MRYAKLVLLILTIFAGYGSVSLATERHVVRMIGQGGDIEFDSRSIPPEMQEAFLVMKVNCMDGTCHSQERIVTTLITGTSPVTKKPYGQAEFRDKVIKMLRSPKSTLSRESAKVIIDFFDYMHTKTTISAPQPAH